MRVLEISASANFGGGPQHIHELMLHLRNDVEIDIACPRQEPYWDRFNTAISGEALEIPERRFTLRAAYSLVHHARRRKVDLIHSHGKGAGVYGRFVTALTGIPLLHTPHGIHLDQYGWFMQRIYLAYERVTGGLAKSTIFVSDSERERAKELRLWRDVEYQVIPNGVRTWSNEQIGQWRDELRRDQQVSGDEVVVVTLSRFDYAKNMLEMASIAHQCRTESKVRFWFVGDGPDRDMVQTYCNRQGMHNVHFPGFVLDPARYLSAADVYLSSSRWEGLPLSLIEAMALGKPVVASNVEGNQDAVDDQLTGFLYPLGQIEAAVRQISTLAHDDVRRRQMGLMGQQRQKMHFAVDIMAAKTLKVYKDLMKKNGNNSPRT